MISIVANRRFPECRSVNLVARGGRSRSVPHVLGSGMILSFDDYEIDIERRELRRAEISVHVEPQVFDLLVFLVQNRDRVVSKDDLIASVWGGRIVSESTLTSRINAARTAVGDSGEEQKLIRTIPRKGLRFVGTVQTQPNGIEAALASGPSPSEIHEQSRPALPLPDRPAIAVLPFINMSGDPEQDYFSDGISEDIITALSKLRWFFVIARNSSFIYKGKAVHMKQVAEELGVGYVVEGSVRKGGDRVRITVQLNDVATGSHIWAERYDRELADVFAVQDEITEAIVAAIEPKLYAAENFHAQRKPPDSMDAWDLVMRALSHYWRVTRQDTVVAQALLEKAISIDPNYGQALGVLATSYTFSAHMGWADMANGGTDCRTCGAGSDPGRQRGPLGAPRVGLCASVCTAFRRLAGRVRIGAAAQSQLLARPGLLRRDAGLLRSLGGGRLGCTPGIAAEPARSLLGDLLRHHCLRPVRRTQLRRVDAASARGHPSARRFCRWPPGTHRLCRHGRTRSRSPSLRCRSCAACNPIFRSPGSRAKCRSSRKRTGNTIWEPSAARAWISSNITW